MKFIVKVKTTTAEHEKLCDSMNDALRWLTKFNSSLVLKVEIDRY